ncbi:hypothetical protein SMA90_33115, partial [Escherichia coli]
VEYLGHFEKRWGYEPGARSRAFRVWSRLRAAYVPRTIGFLVGSALAVLAVAAFEWFAAKPGREHAKRVSEFVALVVLMAGVQFGLVVV